MNDTTRTVLIALGVVLLVTLLVPLLFMTGMMNGGGVWFMGGLVLLILVGITLIAIGGGRPR